MAPSSGAVFGMLARTLKQARAAWQKASRAIEQLPKQAQQATAQAEPIYLRNNTPRHPLHPAAALRQSKGRWYTTHATIKSGTRNFSSAGRIAPSRTPRSAFPQSRIGDAIRRLPGTARAPFASTLRPNLTGGSLGRTAGGYSMGSGRVGGARFFSHTPAAQAQVVQNVSQAMRAFLIGGQKAQFDGVDGRGNKRFRAVTALQKEASSKLTGVPRATPGSFVDFSINPTITALTPLSSVTGFASVQDSYAAAPPAGLQSAGLLDILSADFSRALKDLSIVLNDFRALSSLGDLPITYAAETSTLRVHFPGCDADTVERLCDELGIRRGVVGQDEEFDAFAGTEIALLFPFAPSKTVSECEFFERPVERRHMYTEQRVDWRDMLSEADSEELSTRSQDGFEEQYDDIGRVDESHPWLSSPSGYESIDNPSLGEAHEKNTPLEFRGFEGLYRFMEMCDDRR